MIMNYPEYNSVTSRLRCPEIAVGPAFDGHDVLWPADCVFDGIGLSRLLDNKQGNKYLRYAMIEAVWPALSKCSDLEQVYNRISRCRSGNSAKVAAARRLLTIVYRVLKENREYRYRY